METYNTQLKVGDKISSFNAVATTRKIGFPSDFKGQWIAIITNPVEIFDTEEEKKCFLQLAESLEKKNCQLIGLSTSGMSNDLKWQRGLKGLTNDATLSAILEDLPIINDSVLTVARQCGMINSANEQMPISSLYLIDPDSVVRSISNYIQADSSLPTDSAERLQQIQMERLNGRLTQHRHTVTEQTNNEICCWYF